MKGYFGRRLLRAAILLFGVSTLSFCLFELVPGDYLDELRLDPTTSAETIEALRKQYGLDEPLFVRYKDWLRSVVRGDLGYSVAYRGAAGPLLFDRARNTLVLTIFAALCAWTIAVPFACWTVLGGGLRRLVANSCVSLLLSVPDLLILLVFMEVARRWGLLPTGGMTSFDYETMSFWGKLADVASHVAVPGATLALTALPTLILHTRAALLEALDAPFVRFARANGIPRNRLLARHVWPAAANPIFTLLGLSAGTLLSSSLLVEAIVGWPGLGHLLLQSLLQRDLAVVAGAVLLSSAFLVGGNLLADLLLYASDPRIREDL